MDMFDEELQEMLGDRYDDGQGPSGAQKQEPVKMPALERKVHKFEKPRGTGPVAENAPVPKMVPSYMDRLRGCAKWAVIFGGLTFLLFYWQEAGLMDPMAAVPSMCVCTCLGGFKIGAICRG